MKHFTAEQVEIVIVTDDSACPPWHYSIDFYGHESELRAFILNDANSIGVRHKYIVLKDGKPIAGRRHYWHIWRVL